MIAIVGPTGIGKSEVAYELCRRLPAEIVAVDSMQVYRGMDIGTGKPDASLRRLFPHHGLDLVEPEEPFNAARFVREISPQIASIQERGRRPILVGGSGLYLKGLLDGLSPAPGEDPLVRQRLIAQGIEEGSPCLHAQLKRVDPVSAERIHPNDLKRIVRALEVYQATGQPISRWHEQTSSPLIGKEKCVIFGLTSARDLLYSRIEARIDRWLGVGWCDEARALSQRMLSQTAQEALGYKELFGHLQGAMDWKTAVSLIKRNTRRYAKRQWSWFRQNPRIQWILTDGLTPAVIADQIFQKVPDTTF